MEELGLLPTDWKTFNISDLASVTMGQSPNSSTYNQDGKGMPFVQGNADLGDRNPQIRSFTTDPKKKSYPNDILLTVRAPVGALNINDKEIAIGRGICALNEFDKSLYLYYYLMYNQRLFLRLEQGTTFTEINQKDIKKLKIKAPQDPKEIKSIASILIKVDEAIEATENSIKASEKLKKSLLQNLLNGKLRYDGTWRKDEEFQETKIGFLPNEWEVKRVNDLSIQVTDGEHTTPNRSDTGYYLLSARNVKNSYLDLTDVDYLQEDELRKIQKRCNPQPGDILISCSGTIGNVCIVPEGFDVGMVRSVALVKLKKDLLEPKFAEIMFQSYLLQKQMRVSVSSSVQGNLFQGAIKKLRLPYPSTREERLGIVDKIEFLSTIIESKKLKIQSLKKLKKSLMQNLLTGKVRVDVDKISKLLGIVQ